MSKVTKASNIWTLSDFVQSVLHCSHCKILIASYDDDAYELAEKAYADGWRLDAKGHVRCPECVKKK